MVGSHDLELGRYKHGAVPKPVFMDRLRRFGSKVGKQWFKDYLFFPLLALSSAPRVLAGNFAANLIRNLWTYLVIFCGHFTEGVAIYREEDCQNETRSDWYLRQLAGSSNLTGGRWFHIATGHLSHQIEHHLFPDHAGAPLPRGGAEDPRALRKVRPALQQRQPVQTVPDGDEAHPRGHPAAAGRRAAQLRPCCASRQPISATGLASRPCATACWLLAVPWRARAATPCMMAARRNRL